MRSLLVFVLFAATICWFLFSPIYKHVLVVRQAVLQAEVDYLLEIGSNADHGYIDETMMEQSRLRLAGFGLHPDEIRYEVTGSNSALATSAAAPLPRGTGLSLTISYPVEGLLDIDRLIGIEPLPADSRLRAAGMKMSEYVP
ncbi:hypothetical protein [Paenibacillus humicola]|uniref:hypothetical protein n=1 Tax=Paenibacillus humicola TaxID=3110540 RepID=UPI00237BEF11|nr:hypothetical protein [Paenibacillus humicola]